MTIERVGARGDGIAAFNGRKLFLSFAAPGDRVRARIDGPRGDDLAGTVLELLAPGEGRATPRCRHFGVCGGCALQHLASPVHDAMKLGRIRAALAQHGLADTPMEPLKRVAPGTRRRARLSIALPSRGASPPRVGFQGQRSHDVVDLTECAVLHPLLTAMFAPIRALTPRLWRPGESGSVTLTLAESGIDALIDLPRAPALAALETLAGFAEAQDLARLAWRAGPHGEIEPVAQRRPVRVVFGGVPVDLPPDTFLQASGDADALLAAEVLAGVGDAQRVADLFAGVGTFTFPLARRGATVAVHAVEGSAPAVAALNAAARRAGLSGRTTAARRDLDARPLGPDELEAFDTVVFDPPRAGAKAQVAELARSRVKRVVAVSCNPATFARDARRLVDGGYTLARLQPIDQFLWSPHVELVAAFERR